jgi:alkylation response protein AidB-like acyl-CoA dehydrogenase
MSSDFPAFALPEEHEALRQAVRELADDKIAPRAAEVDESGEFPWDVFEALVKADFAAVHIPEAYGGAGADAIATAIVIEEVARACASSSLIPAVNKLGTVPLLLAGSAELKQRYLPPVARGEAMFSYALSEPEAGSDAAAMSTRAVRNGETFILNGTKRWITNAGVSRFYTVMAVTDPAAGANGISAFVAREPGSRPPWPRWTTPGSPSPRRPSVSPRARWTMPPDMSGSAVSSARPSRTSRASSSCWPTWP